MKTQVIYEKGKYVCGECGKPFDKIIQQVYEFVETECYVGPGNTYERDSDRDFDGMDKVIANLCPVCRSVLGNFDAEVVKRIIEHNAGNIKEPNMTFPFPGVDCYTPLDQDDDRPKGQNHWCEENVDLSQFPIKETLYHGRTGGSLSAYKLESGDLLLAADREARDDIAFRLGLEPWKRIVADLLDGMLGNGFSWLSPSDLSALVGDEALILGFDIDQTDDGKYDVKEDSAVWWHASYQVHDPLATLRDRGLLIMQYALAGI